MANVLPLDVKLMDLLQVLSARYPQDTDIGEAYQLAGELSCSEEGLAERLSEQEANWTLLAETMRGYSDTAGDHHWKAAEAIELLVTMRQLFLPLLNWKRQALAVEAEWDAQAVGKLCDVPLGQSIRPAIEPTLIALKKRVAELEAKVAAQHLDLREVEKLLNAVHTVQKAVEVQSGRKMGENETFEDFVITHLGGVQLKADVALKMMTAIEAMRVSGGRAEFQLAYDRALGLLEGGSE